MCNEQAHWEKHKKSFSWVKCAAEKACAVEKQPSAAICLCILTLFFCMPHKCYSTHETYARTNTYTCNIHTCAHRIYARTHAHIRAQMHADKHANIHMHIHTRAQNKTRTYAHTTCAAHNQYSSFLTQRYGCIHIRIHMHVRLLFRIHIHTRPKHRHTHMRTHNLRRKQRLHTFSTQQYTCIHIHMNIHKHKHAHTHKQTVQKTTIAHHFLHNTRTPGPQTPVPELRAKIPGLKQHDHGQNQKTTTWVFGTQIPVTMLTERVLVMIRGKKDQIRGKKDQIRAGNDQTVRRMMWMRRGTGLMLRARAEIGTMMMNFLSTCVREMRTRCCICIFMYVCMHVCMYVWI
jgi:hypothetical protein